MNFRKGVLLASLLALGACNSPDTLSANASMKVEPQPSRTAVLPAQVSQAAPKPAATKADADAAPRSCAAEIGTAAAAERVEICRSVSPATHPPCNAANSCAMIEDEIARSCALFDAGGPAVKGCRSEPKGTEAAADVVRRYYAAIDAHDYATAWSQWGDGGQPGQSFETFQRGFAHTRSVKVTIGALKPGDAGAGSIYQPVPVTVDATLDDDTRQHFTGSYIVRRVNNVDGASPSQLRWHLNSAQLRRGSAR